MIGLAVGCVAAAVAFATVSQASELRLARTLDAQRAADVPAPPAATAPEPAPPRPVQLAPAADVPRLLARLERTAGASALAWTQADYRIADATDNLPASLEVRVTLKGPYPAVRRFVTAALLDNPSLTFKEFAISRASSAATNVDARLGIVVWLAPAGGLP